jgi:hypothetical protein
MQKELMLEVYGLLVMQQEGAEADGLPLLSRTAEIANVKKVNNKVYLSKMKSLVWVLS